MDFWLSFVPLFVAVDALGVLPMFHGLTADISDASRKKIILQSVLTATVVALIFLFLGKGILSLLGISVSDFMIAGGILLFAISMGDLLSADKPQRRVDPESLGAVPIGVPLMAGPAVFTTSILVLDQHGFVYTSISLVLNILIAGLLFYYSKYLINLMGKSGSKAFSKIANLFLAAIAIMLVRKGIEQVIVNF